MAPPTPNAKTTKAITCSAFDNPSGGNASGRAAPKTRPRRSVTGHSGRSQSLQPSPSPASRIAGITSEAQKEDITCLRRHLQPPLTAQPLRHKVGDREDAGRNCETTGPRAEQHHRGQQQPQTGMSESSPRTFDHRRGSQSNRRRRLRHQKTRSRRAEDRRIGTTVEHGQLEGKISLGAEQTLDEDRLTRQRGRLAANTPGGGQAAGAETGLPRRGLDDRLAASRALPAACGLR